MTDDARPTSWRVRLGGVLAALFALVWTLPNALLLAVAHTWNGRAVALAGVALAVAMLAWVARRLRAAVGIAMLGLAVFGAALLGAPSGDPGDGPLTSHWRDGYPRFHIASVVPEVDQFEFGTWLVAGVDRHVDAARAARLRALVRSVYLPTREDPAFVEAGSAMPGAYEVFRGGPRDYGHHYAFVPASEAPLPVVLFLHGSLGNFKGYTAVFARHLDGWAVVAPSFGLGDWRVDGAEHVIGRALEAIRRDPRLDESRVIVVGLSNGGLGVTRALARDRAAFRGAVYLNAVIEPDLARAAVYDLPVLIVTAEDDARIPTHFHRDAQAWIPGSRLVSFAREDHFLFFSQPASVCGLIARFGARVAPPRAMAGDALR